MLFRHRPAYPTLSPFFSALPYKIRLTPLFAVFTHFDRGVGVSRFRLACVFCRASTLKFRVSRHLRTLCRQENSAALCFQQLAHSFCKIQGGGTLSRVPGGSPRVLLGGARPSSASRQERTCFRLATGAPSLRLFSSLCRRASAREGLAQHACPQQAGCATTKKKPASESGRYDAKLSRISFGYDGLGEEGAGVRGILEAEHETVLTRNDQVGLVVAI